MKQDTLLLAAALAVAVTVVVSCKGNNTNNHPALTMTSEVTDWGWRPAIVLNTNIVIKRVETYYDAVVYSNVVQECWWTQYGRKVTNTYPMSSPVVHQKTTNLVHTQIHN